MYDHLGIMFFIVIAVITALAVIRSLVKMKKRKGINITPVGVFNDLPESVTGIRKDKEHMREILEKGLDQKAFFAIKL